MRDAHSAMANHTHCRLLNGVPANCERLDAVDPLAPPKTSVHSLTSFSTTMPNASVTMAR